MKGTAAVLEDRKLEIIEKWVEEVRQELPAPTETADPVLRDHLPLLLDDIISIMRRYEDLEIDCQIRNFDGMLQNSIGHGRHRSSSEGYDVAQVLKEYIILHRILTATLRSEEVLHSEVSDLLKFVIENSMLYAVSAFNDSLQQMRQKMMGILAHDIRNPASVAYASVSMLQQNDPPEQFEKIQEMCKNSLKRTLDLLENLLKSVTVEAGEGMTLHFSERDLLRYIQSTYSEASAIYSNEIILNCEAKEIRGVFDCAMIRRVLENIVNNAVKYGRRDTPITITVHDCPEEVKISVHNEGNPIPEANQQEIFQFLKTTNGHGPRKLKSWGMGLSLVKAVARAHGGSLQLESSEKKGTTFTLILSKNENPGTVKTSLSYGSK